MNMRPLTEQEKRTIRLASVALVIGLGLAAFLWCGKHLRGRRADYQALLVESRDVRDEINLYQDKAAVAQKLMENFHLDPMTLARTSLVAQASAAIQKASADSGVAPGVMRESTAKGAAKEVATIQFEGTGPVPAIMMLLYQLERGGSPLIIDSVQLSADSHRPGAMKVSLSIVVLDFDQWKKEGRPNA